MVLNPGSSSLDLVSRTLVDALVVAPGTVHSSVLGRLRMVLGLQPLNEFFDFVGL